MSNLANVGYNYITRMTLLQVSYLYQYLKLWIYVPRFLNCAAVCFSFA